MHYVFFSVSGLSYRRDNVEENDNAINIEVDIVLSDNAVSDDNAVFSFSFGAKLGNYIFITDQDIVVQRTGTEKPVLKVDASVNETLSTRYFFPFIIFKKIYKKKIVINGFFFRGYIIFALFAIVIDQQKKKKKERKRIRVTVHPLLYKYIS